MAYFSGKIPTPTDGFTLRVDYAYSQYPASNKTTINTITGKVKRNNSSYFPNNSSKTTTLKIERKNDAGTWVTVTTLSSSSSYSISTDNYYTWVSGSSIDIAHKTDGTQQIRLTFTVNGKLSSYYPLGSITSTVTLPALHTPPEITGYTITELNSATLPGIANNVFVFGLSSKKFTISANFYDGATATLYRIFNGLKYFSSATNKVTIDLATNTIKPWSLDSTKIPIISQVIDSLAGSDIYPNSTTTPDLYSYVPYFLPTLITTDTKTTRNGQLSGKVNLNASGSFYNANVGSTTQSITVKYYYWVKGTTEPATWITIPSASVSVVGNKFTITDYKLGTDFDANNAYDIKIKINDRFKDFTVTKGVSVGKATWTEYIDRVDFEKLTIQGLDMMDAIFYKKGDTFELPEVDTAFNGYVTSGTTNLVISVGTPKSMKNIETITCDILQAEMRCLNGYINSTSGYQNLKAAGYTITCTKIHDYLLKISIVKSTAYTNIPNNTLVSLNFKNNFKLTFS